MNGQTLFQVAAKAVESSGSITVTDWATAITIVLTALAVLLAALGIMIAGAAIWGYSSIKDEARKIAKREARKTAEQVAAKIATESVEKVYAFAQAGGLTESQSQDLQDSAATYDIAPQPPKKATTDSGLTENGGTK